MGDEFEKKIVDFGFSGQEILARWTFEFNGKIAQGGFVCRYL